jgi:hypothetical protein
MASSWQSRVKLTKGPDSIIPDDAATKKTSFQNKKSKLNVQDVLILFLHLTPNNFINAHRFSHPIVGKCCPTLRRSSKTT